MRIDKYLKASRIINRRTVACDACNAGRVTVNGKTVKPAYEVNAGDIIEIRFGSNLTKFEVLSLIENPKKDEAHNMYKSL